MRVRLVLIFSILAAAGAGIFYYVRPASAGGSAEIEAARAKVLTLRGDWQRVKRGDFEISIQEDGELKPVKVTSLTFLVPGKVAFIAPEGSYVKQGDRVIALETKDLEEEISHIQEDLAAAELALHQQEQARELDLKRLATELQAEVEKATFGELKLHETLAHPDSVEKEQAKNTIESATARTKTAQAQLEVLKPLYDLGFTSRQEFEQKVVALDKAKIENTRAEMKARILNYGALDDDRANAKLDCENAGLGLAIKKIDNKDQLHQLDIRQRSYERVVKQVQVKLDRRKLELERSTLHAPHDGVVVYRTMGYRGNKKPEVGERVSPWIAPIDLPNYETMKVRTQAPESLIRTLHARGPAAADGSEPARGSAARVTVNTLPGVSYTGQVTWIDGWARDRNSRLSDADVKAQGLSGVKVFDVEVELDQSDPKHLREGFRARVDFPETTLRGVIAIPEQCVSTIDGVSTVMVMDGSPVARKVELGRVSRGGVVITAGLKEGEQVWVPKLIAPPAQEENSAKKGGGKAGKPGDKKSSKGGKAPARPEGDAEKTPSAPKDSGGRSERGGEQPKQKSPRAMSDKPVSAKEAL